MRQSNLFWMLYKCMSSLLSWSVSVIYCKSVSVSYHESRHYLMLMANTTVLLGQLSNCISVLDSLTTYENLYSIGLPCQFTTCLYQRCQLNGWTKKSIPLWYLDICSALYLFYTAEQLANGIEKGIIFYISQFSLFFIIQA